MEKFSVRKECQSGFQHNRQWGVFWHTDGCWANQGTAVRVQGLGKRIFQAGLQDIKAGVTANIVLSTPTDLFSQTCIVP